MGAQKAAKALATAVHVAGDDGRFIVFPAGTKVGDATGTQVDEMADPVEFTKDFAEKVTNPKAWTVADDEDGDDPDDEPSAYASLKVADLKAEIEKRNDGREDDAKLSLEGNKVALIAALEADDQAAQA